MKDDTKELLDDLLVQWHKWAKGYTPVSTHSACAMFKGSKSSRQWDSESEVLDGDLHNEQMKMLDFHINELCDVYRTALQINARNLYTGKSVWSSPRLPEDQKQRQEILADARNSLCIRLRIAGVI